MHFPPFEAMCIVYFSLGVSKVLRLCREDTERRLTNVVTLFKLFISLNQKKVFILMRRRRWEEGGGRLEMRMMLHCIPLLFFPRSHSWHERNEYHSFLQRKNFFGFFLGTSWRFFAASLYFYPVNCTCVCVMWMNFIPFIRFTSKRKSVLKKEKVFCYFFF